MLKIGERQFDYCGLSGFVSCHLKVRRVGQVFSWQLLLAAEERLVSSPNNAGFEFVRPHC